MSRIQDILSKAERDGTARRTRSIVGPEPSPGRDDYAGRPSEDGAKMRAFVETGPTARPSLDEVRPGRGPQIDEPFDPALVRPFDKVQGDSPRAAPVTEVPRLARPAVPETAFGSTAPHVRFTEPVPGAPPEPLDTSQGRPPAPTVTGVTSVDMDVLAAPGSELDHLLVAALAPTSLAAEQYRSLRTRLKRAEAGRTLRTIAITSPAKGDGKSLTVSNLALTMAQEFQQRVLLVDADLRRPTIHRLFGVADSPGLADVLMSMADLDQALITLPDHHLTILPAGIPPNHPAELLGSATMRRILDTLRTRFDRILIDVPPVAPLADLHILAPMVDGLMMIVRAGITPKPAIERALAGLDQSKVLGLVLNEAGNEGADGYYNYEGYGYVAG
jgi:capsular exopolysaccharide synthesis family protein